MSDSGCNQAVAVRVQCLPQTVAALTPHGLHRAARTNDPLALPVGVKGNRVQGIGVRCPRSLRATAPT